MAGNTITPVRENRPNRTTTILLILPLILLGAVILLFVRTGGDLKPTVASINETLNFERTVLKPGQIDIYVRNASPKQLQLAQVIINNAVWPFSVSPTNSIDRLRSAIIHINYPWSPGEAYAIRIFSTNAIPFDVQIPYALQTQTTNSRTFLGFTLIGLYVGVIPIYLGLVWFPALRKLGRRWMTFLLAATAGLLVFLGIDTLAEAFDQAANLPGSFQGIGLIGIGAVATFFLLEAITKRQAGIGKSEAAQRLNLAYMIAVGIGLHNLGEGLAIGAAYSTGQIALGSFLVVGFIIQNITEGLGIIAPVLKDQPGVRNLALMGFVGGAPAILGAWIGGFSPSPVLAVLFLGIGAGAIFEVVYEIARMVQKDTARQPMPVTVFAGIVSGMLLLWVTGLLIK